MRANFVEGAVEWTVNGVRKVRMESARTRDLMIGGKDKKMQWVCFVAMYNYLDAVEWRIL